MGLGERKRFRFFDQIIESEIDLPELAGVDDREARVEVLLRLSADRGEFTTARPWLHHWRAPDQSITLSLAAEDERLILHFPGLARFAIGDHGRLVTCYAGPLLSPATIRHLLIDQVLPRLFAHFHPHPVFHASFLAVKHRGVAFFAGSGWGKSTIAAALGAAGHTILTDDCLRIALHEGCITGTPAYCGIRLLPDSLAQFGDSLKTEGQTVAEYTSKQRIAVEPAVLGSVPLKALFLLGSPEDADGCTAPEITPAGGMHAMKALLNNSFCLDVHNRQWQQRHFLRLARLAVSGLPIFSLKYPRDYQALPEVVRAVGDALDNIGQLDGGRGE